MSIRYSLSQRTAAHNSLFAALACAITLTLTTGPALAQDSSLQRVEISGRVVDAPARLDVHKHCRNIDQQLENALGGTWQRYRHEGRVNVNLLMERGEITAVEAKGRSALISRAVRNAVQHLDCGPQQIADAQLFRFAVDFVDTESMSYRQRQERMAAGAHSGVSVVALSN